MPVIPRNSIFPNYKSLIIKTYEDNQTSILIKIYEGKQQLAKDNKLLKQFTVDGIPPLPKGKASIELNFILDENSELKINIINKYNNLKKEIIIKDERRTKEDIEKWVNDANLFKKEELLIKECVNYKINLEQYCYQIKQTINDIKLNDNFMRMKKEEIENQVVSCINWINENNNATKYDYEQKLKEMKILFDNFMEKIKNLSNKGKINNSDIELKELQNSNNISKKDKVENLLLLNSENKIKMKNKSINKIKNINKVNNDIKLVNNKKKGSSLNKNKINIFNKKEKELKSINQKNIIINEENLNNKKLIEAKKKLYEYCDKAKQIINENKNKNDKLIDEIIKWNSFHSNSLIEEYEEKIKKVKNIINKNKIILAFNEEIKKLTKKLIEMKKENQKLNNEINSLNEKLKIKNNLKNDEYMKLKDLNNIMNNKSNFKTSTHNFCLIPKEKYIIIMIISNDQNINYSIRCNKKDQFSKIEDLVYNKYPEYRGLNNFFTSKGKIIIRNKTIEENEINNNEIIILNS